MKLRVMNMPNEITQDIYLNHAFVQLTYDTLRLWTSPYASPQLKNLDGETIAYLNSNQCWILDKKFIDAVNTVDNGPYTDICIFN